MRTYKNQKLLRKKNAERVHIRVKIPFPQHFPAKADKRPDTCTAPLRPLPVLPPFTTFPDLFPAFHRTSFSNRPFDNPEHSRSYAPSVPCCRWPRPYPPSVPAEGRPFTGSKLARGTLCPPRPDNSAHRSRQPPLSENRGGRSTMLRPPARKGLRRRLSDACRTYIIT